MSLDLIMRSPHVQAVVDLDRIRAAAEQIRRATRVRVIAVIKSDAYGLGAPQVADVLAPVVDDFAYFSVHEAREVGRPGLVLGPPDGDPAEYRELNLRPAIDSHEQAQRFAGLPVALHVDVGMQRFGAAPEAVDDLLRRHAIGEAFAHAVAPAAVEKLVRACGGRVSYLHAAATCLLGEPATWLDAVRPGLALYRGALRVTTRLALVRPTRGPVGYSGFESPHVGVIFCGYGNQLRAAPVVINGRRQQILEVGMNSAFVSVDSQDRVGDEVVLLGEELPESELARHFGCREHEVLCRYGALGVRRYAAVRAAVS